MKLVFLLSSSFLIISMVTGCNKEDISGLPVLSTAAVIKVSGVSMTSGGNITSDGGATVTSRGICWGTNPDQISDENRTSDGTGTGNFTSNMSGLNASTTYFVRAYATNSKGTAYGNQVSFKTNISDIDGNIYHSIAIGEQIWMVENLRVTHLNNGSDIKLITSDLEWKTSNSPSYCWYFNIVPEEGNNGALYNFNTVNTGKLCPTGWNVPSDQDWKTLELYLGMSQAEGDMVSWRGEGISSSLKAVEGWYVLNGIQDMFGFKALPSGIRHGVTGGFQEFNLGAYWWSSTIYDESSAWFRSIIDANTTIYRGTQFNQSGFSVRCLKGS